MPFPGYGAPSQGCPKFNFTSASPHTITTAPAPRTTPHSVLAHGPDDACTAIGLHRMGPANRATRCENGTPSRHTWQPDHAHNRRPNSLPPRPCLWRSPLPLLPLPPCQKRHSGNPRANNSGFPDDCRPPTMSLLLLLPPSQPRPRKEKNAPSTTRCPELATPPDAPLPTSFIATKSSAAAA
ncbi:hypothetical protein CALCODRAFT_494145 [Calocera cornea HHB12733]|uniref:Uncharacterized protein n=1 Tax=Calocera cornea HHB12733 TaxID=1353952 RepID=A0A165HC05_9BASI|nr:hypothetical protein CALCODRAFT_494145 [Calocera cornea HHB12733]